MERRIDDLFEYLNELNNLNRSGYHCDREISECIAEVRKELEIAGERG